MSNSLTRSKRDLFRLNGCSNHSDYTRNEYDYYATDPIAAEWLLKIEPDLSDCIWECACGENHLANVLKKAGKSVRCSDLVVRTEDVEQLDFLSCDIPVHNMDIVTNPPYKNAQQFVEKALSLVDEGRYVCMFLKLTFLEGQKRRMFFDKQPPIRVHVTSNRISCMLNGQKFDNGGAVCYAWFVWKKGYTGYPELRWFN